ncbi:MAG TPA: shikimate dehydrogenase [Allosphingosinicella sp.]|nr:shikimate dehydrogenase [Allosphingosinicella sp.]
MGVPYAEVIGDPIDHSKSPLIHKFWLGKLGMEGDYRATRVRPDELPDYLKVRRRDPNWRGSSVTMPLKERVLTLLDEVDDNGIGAVNCVLPLRGRLVGRNTDMVGIRKPFEWLDTSRPVCLIGNGGAARAVIEGLGFLSVLQFNFLVRDVDKGARLVERAPMGGLVFGFDKAEEAIAGSNGVINATPMGMTGCDRMPASILAGLKGLLGPRLPLRDPAFVFDLVYTPLETPLLAAARTLGVSAIDGLTMLIGQAEAAFEAFFGAAPPVAEEAALTELLTR